MAAVWVPLVKKVQSVRLVELRIVLAKVQRAAGLAMAAALVVQAATADVAVPEEMLPSMAAQLPLLAANTH